MKKVYKKLLCLIISAVMVIGTVPAFEIVSEAADYPFATDNYVETDDFRFYLWDMELDGGEDKGAVLVKFKKTGILSDADIVIPEFVEGRPVTVIYNEAFSYAGIRSIIIPETVTEIRENAFSRCFKLEKIKIPDSVIRIDNNAFVSCSNLVNVSFGNNLQIIGNSAFNGCNLFEAVLPPNLKTIGASAFSNNHNLSHVVLPDGLESIGNGAFSDCFLKEFIIPDSVTYVGERILSGNYQPIENLVLPTSTDEVRCYGNVKSIYIPDTGDTPVKINKALASTYVDDCKGDYYFEGKLDIEGIKDLKSYCYSSYSWPRFHFRNKLSNDEYKLMQAGTYESIRCKYTGFSNGYYDYSFLRQISNTNKFGDWLVKSVYPSNNGEVMIAGYLGYVDESGEIDIPQEISAFGGRKVPVVGIVENSFSHIPGIKKVCIPESVSIIEESAFEDCKDLEEINLSENITDIGKNAFKDCPKLKRIGSTAPDNIGEYAFAGDVELRELPNLSNLTVVKAFTFEYAGKNSDTTIEINFGNNLQRIYRNAFAQANICFYSLPDSLKTIQEYAFCGTKITELTIPESIGNIPDGAFMDCRELTAANIESVITVSSLAFSGCKNLSTLTVSDNLQEIESLAFRNCYSLNFLPDEAVETAEFAFSEDNGDVLVIRGEGGKTSNLSINYTDKIVFADDVQQIGFTHFYKAGEVHVPDSVTGTIDFSGDIDTVYCNSVNTDNIYLRNLNINTLVFGEQVSSIPAEICSENKYLKKAVFLGRVEEVGEYAFENCSALETVESPFNIGTVGTAAFRGCSMLDFNSLPCIENIGYSAFEYCCFTDIELKEGTETIDENSFRLCHIRTVTLPKSLFELNSGAFNDNPGIKTIIYNCENLKIKAKATTEGDAFSSPFAVSKCLEDITVGNSVKEIAANAFCRAKAESVTVSSSVTDIGDYAFAYSEIENLSLECSPESILNYAFYSCNYITAFDFTDNLILIGNYAFGNCVNLTDVSIPDNVIDLGDGAFINCSALESVRMSSSVNYIGKEAFKNCVSLRVFEWNSQTKYIGKEAFYGCVSLESFDFDGTAKFYGDSFKESGITTVILGESRDETVSDLRIIEVCSFTRCASLETVAIGGQVSQINDYSFSDCENLETAIISNSVKKISSTAFENCPKLTIYCSEDSYAYNYAKANNINVSTFVVAPIPNQRYTGKELEPAVSVTVSGAPLSKGEDFKVKYSDNINAGTATVKVSGINTYKMFSSIVNFAILTRDISEAEIDGIADQHYTGSEITPALRVIYNGKLLREGSDYKVIYTNNTAAGKAKATVTGIGNFSGTTTAEFNITENGGETESPILTFFRNVASFISRVISFFISLFK